MGINTRRVPRAARAAATSAQTGQLAPGLRGSRASAWCSGSSSTRWARSHLGGAGPHPPTAGIARRNLHAAAEAAGAPLVGVAAAVAGARRPRRLHRRHSDHRRRRSPTPRDIFCSRITVAFFGWLFLSVGLDARRAQAPDRDRRVLRRAHALFWSVFEQAGSTLNLFADRNTQQLAARAATFRAAGSSPLNPLFIIIFAPVFAWLWIRLAERPRARRARSSSRSA